MLSRWLKSVVVGAFVVGSSLALALPTPKDIEAAVAAGRYTQAESMLREVLQDKPQSAKAHYELGQVLAQSQRYKEAQSELQKAKDIDPSLKFATSPEKFNTVLAKINDLAAAPSSSVVMAPSAAPSVAPSTQAVSKASPEPAAMGGGSSLTYVWLAIAGLVVFGLWLRRSTINAAKNAQAAGYVPAASPMGGASMSSTMATPMGSPAAPRGFGAQFTPNAAQGGYAPQGYGPQGGYAQPNTRGSGIGGAVVGGLAGVAAGYALSKALEGDHQAAPSAAAGASPAADNGGYVPFNTPAQPDLGSFDAGSGGDWDSGDSGGGDDSW
ncbi:tetratricopeptide repeat protein [Limnohabitans sp.]|uniref:tetratricopeptide repeat protein n=1 Tax=Limnohabitans sp. TaxID=1907725 RepID=UPI00333F59FD